jgi:predicted MPP superfamily phosphohydrolase
MISRRAFLGSSLAAAAAVGGYAWQVEPHWLEITRQPLVIHGLGERLRAATLVQVSDLHVGPRVSDAYVLDTFRRVKALAPDIVAYTGDFISYHDDVMSHAARIYTHAPHGRLATIGVLGNHDYGPQWAHPELASRLTSLLAEYGIRVLRNEVYEIEGLQIAGMDDMWGTTLRPASTIEQLAAHRPAIVLSHNPDSVDLSGWDGFEGWILSGHTHGGQCKPPFLPPPMLPVRNHRYTCGAFDLAGNRRMYISRGVGHLLHVRFNVRPEVALFELRPS